MSGRDAASVRASNGGRSARALRRHARRVAVAAAAAALCAGTACAGSRGPGPIAPGALAAEVDAAHGLYASGEYELAARRFGFASTEARRAGDRDLERRTKAAECTAWLRAQRIARFATCTDRLEGLQRRARSSDPGVNTLIALGAIAGGRPAPPLRIPGEVREVLRAAAGEER